MVSHHRGFTLNVIKVSIWVKADAFSVWENPDITLKI